LIVLVLPGAEGFEWTKEAGMVGLGHPTGASSRATAISADGSTIVGFYEDPVQGFRRPVRWISGSTDLFLGTDLPGEGIAVSSDGSQIVGQATDSNWKRTRVLLHGSGWPDFARRARRQSNRPERCQWCLRQWHCGRSQHQSYVLDEPTLCVEREDGSQSSSGGAGAPGRSHPQLVSTLTNVLAISADGTTLAGIWVDANFNQGPWIVQIGGKAALK